MKVRTVLTVTALIATVIGLSLLSNSLWGARSKQAAASVPDLRVTEQTTVRDIAFAYRLEPRSLKRAFHLRSSGDLNRTIAELGISSQAASESIRRVLAVAGEESSKNWKKILAKFALWFAFLSVVFRQVRRGTVSPGLRKTLLLISVLIFGVILGSDPSPMGTVKDAVVLWGREHVIFPPRLVALGVFALMTVLANKFICSWGCQFGALQDLVFRLNRNRTDSSGLLKQWKPAFALTNGVRIASFVAMVVFAVASSTDIVGPIDPFKVFSPMSMGVAGMAFAVGVLTLSLFVYRPWCHLFCPFGLVGWLLERLSVYKIRVNYESCVGCEACVKACPSTVMGAILAHDRTVPDCFSCGTCQAICPTKSISFSRGRRAIPPHGRSDGLGASRKQSESVGK